MTELVTPGVSFNDQVLDHKRNNYVAALSYSEKESLFGLAFLDISTGEFMCSQGPLAYIQKMVQSFMPSEILYPKNTARYIWSILEMPSILLRWRNGFLPMSLRIH